MGREYRCLRCGGALSSLRTGQLRCVQCGEMSPDGAGLASLGPDAQRLVMGELLLRAARAREDIIEFFDFVMEDEVKHLPLVAAAHQRVGLRFIMGHRRSANMWPAEHSKTFGAVAITLFMLGRYPELRGAFVSAAQEQCKKALRLVSDYVLNSQRLHLVFPELVPSDRRDEPWTQTAITVRRPPGTRDASLVAVGYEGSVLGSRLDWAVVDDILTPENVATADGRKKVIDWVDGVILSRITAKPESRVALMNTAWHPDDLLHWARKRGWATLRMTISGVVDIQDDSDEYNRVEGGEMWDSPELRLSKHYPFVRLAAHDPDPDEVVPLWPEVFPPERVAKLKRERLPHTFNQMYDQVAHDDANAMCKREWIEQCKKNARDFGVHQLVDRWDNGTSFCGIDLAIQLGEHNDDTAFFTIGIHRTGHRQILDIDYGKFDGPMNVAKLGAKIEAYNVALARVENNGGQDFFRQWALDKDVALPLEAHTTTARKSHPEDGIQSLFLEIYNGAWLIPNDKHGNVDPRVQRFIDACLAYVPDKHTDDVLMAAWFAQQGARKWGLGTTPVPESEG